MIHLKQINLIKKKIGIKYTYKAECEQHCTAKKKKDFK